MASFLVCKFAVALPDGSAVTVVGVPDLGTEECSAILTDQLGRKDVLAAVGFAEGFSSGNLKMSYVKGETIKRLREEIHLTQRELAEKLQISDKAVSKWETARGLPDISLLSDLAEALGVSIAELMMGNIVKSRNRTSNMLKTVFCICPVCGI